MNIEFILGLDFSGYNIRLTEVKREKDKVTVTNLDQIKTEIDFHDPLLFEMISDPDVALHIVSCLTKMLHRNKITAKVVSVSLSASTALLLTIPLDNNMLPEDKRESIRWELSNYYPSVSPDTFNSALYTLSCNEESSKNLLVAVNKEIVLFLKNILTGLGYIVKKFDIDHFAALKSTLPKAIEMDRRDYCIIGFRGNYMDIGKIKDASLTEYSAGFLPDVCIDISEPLTEFLRGKIEEPCYFFGENFSPELVSTLAKHFNLKYYGVLDPFQSLDIIPALDINKKIVSNRSDFAFSVGSVLGIK